MRLNLYTVSCYTQSKIRVQITPGFRVGAQISWHSNSWISTTKILWFPYTNTKKVGRISCKTLPVKEWCFLWALYIFWDDLSWDLTLRKIWHKAFCYWQFFCFYSACKFWAGFCWTKNAKYVLILLIALLKQGKFGRPFLALFLTLL